jgi:hypothetical protein
VPFAGAMLGLEEIRKAMERGRLRASGRTSAISAASAIVRPR